MHPSEPKPDEIRVGDRVEACEGRYFGTTGEVVRIEDHPKGWWIFVRRDSDGEVVRMWWCNLALEVPDPEYPGK